MRLTIARYYTPLGRSIQKSYSAGNTNYHEELRNRFKDGELLNADSIKHNGGKTFKTKAGKIVYSGGGITPDVFVAVDTAGFNKLLGQVFIRGTINNFVYQNYLSNKNMFAAYKSSIEFEKNKY